MVGLFFIEKQPGFDDLASVSTIYCHVSSKPVHAMLGIDKICLKGLGKVIRCLKGLRKGNRFTRLAVRLVIRSSTSLFAFTYILGLLIYHSFEGEKRQRERNRKEGKRNKERTERKEEEFIITNNLQVFI